MERIGTINLVLHHQERLIPPHMAALLHELAQGVQQLFLKKHSAPRVLGRTSDGGKKIKYTPTRCGYCKQFTDHDFANCKYKDQDTSGKGAAKKQPTYEQLRTDPKKQEEARKKPEPRQNNY